MMSSSLALPLGPSAAALAGFFAATGVSQRRTFVAPVEDIEKGLRIFSVIRRGGQRRWCAIEVPGSA